MNIVIHNQHDDKIVKLNDSTIENVDIEYTDEILENFILNKPHSLSPDKMNEYVKGEYMDKSTHKKHNAICMKYININDNANVHRCLGFFYGVIGNDYDKAEYWYLKSAERCDARAQFNVGFIYHEIKKDYEKAEYWYLKSAEQGNADAQKNLGYYYHYVIKDYEKTEYWYLKSAKQGNTGAQNNIGLLYQQIKKDYDKAEYWYLKSANNGLVIAHRNVSIFYNKIKHNHKKKSVS